jgi:hypothetical protein
MVMEVRTELTVIAQGHNGPLWLCAEAMYGNEVWYTIRVFPIYSHEQRLTSGRFAHFTHDSLEYKATARLESYSSAAYSSPNFEEFNSTAQVQAEWCADQCAELGGKWSMSLHPSSVHNIDITFSFDNPTVAVAFKLVWS